VLQRLAPVAWLVVDGPPKQLAFSLSLLPDTRRQPDREKARYW